MPIEIQDALSLLDLAIRHGFEVGEARRLRVAVVGFGVGTPAEDAAVEENYRDFQKRLAQSEFVRTDRALQAEVDRLIRAGEGAQREAGASLRLAARFFGEGPARSVPVSTEPVGASPPPLPEPIPVAVPYLTNATVEPDPAALFTFGVWKDRGFVNHEWVLDPTQFRSWSDLTWALLVTRQCGWSGDWLKLFRMIGLAGPPWDNRSLTTPEIAVRAIHASARMANPREADGVYRDLIQSVLGSFRWNSEDPSQWRDPKTAEMILASLRLAKAIEGIVANLPQAVLHSLRGETFGEQGRPLDFFHAWMGRAHTQLGPEIVALAQNPATTPEQMQSALESRFQGGAAEGARTPVEPKRGVGERGPEVVTRAGAEVAGHRPVATGKAGVSGEVAVTTMTTTGQPPPTAAPRANALDVTEGGMTFVSRNPLGSGTNTAAHLTRGQFRAGETVGEIVPLEAFWPPRPVPQTAPHHLSWQPWARGGAIVTSSAVIGAPKFAVSYGATMALFGEWQRFRNITFWEGAKLFVSMAIGFSLTRTILRSVLPSLVRHSFRGGLIDHGIPLAVGVLAANLVNTGSPQFGSMAVTVPALLGASACLGRLIDLQKLTKIVLECLHPLAQRSPWGLVLALAGAWGGLWVAALFRETLIFSLAHGANISVAKAARWFADQKTLAQAQLGEREWEFGFLKESLFDLKMARLRHSLPREASIAALTAERDRAKERLAKEFRSCRPEEGFGFGCLMIRDATWIGDENERVRWGARREMAIHDFYDPQIAALERELGAFRRRFRLSA